MYIIQSNNRFILSVMNIHLLIVESVMERFAFLSVQHNT